MLAFPLLEAYHKTLESVSRLHVRTNNSIGNDSVFLLFAYIEDTWWRWLYLLVFPLPPILCESGANERLRFYWIQYSSKVLSRVPVLDHCDFPSFNTLPKCYNQLWSLCFHIIYYYCHGKKRISKDISIYVVLIMEE